MLNHVYNITDYDFTRVKNTKCLINQHNRSSKKKGYKNLLCAFDIETTKLNEIEQTIMYTWQFSILFLDEPDRIDTIIGRTWTEFRHFLTELTDDDNNAYYMIFVHNLSYEFQFLRGIYSFSPEEVFAIKSRKILKCSMHDRFEFRCSYLQTNSSLDSFTSKMGVTHQKLSGEKFDYSKTRYPWTPLTEYEQQYCINDTIGLVEAMHKRMTTFDDTLYTLPLTSTGYVRRETKRAMYGWAKKHKNMFPDITVFNLLEKAFRGGDTHANRYYANITLRSTGRILGIGSYDRSSSYPDVICNGLFPMTPFREIGTIDEQTYDKKKKLGKALLFEVSFTNIRQKDEYYGAPYISLSKCENVSRETIDNGRILKADTLTTTITDIDFDIIRSEYTWDSIKITNCYESKYAPLPEQLKDVVRKYYTDKTELKGVAGQEIYYAMKKALLNAVYGMMVQSPVKQSLLFLEENEDPYQIDESVSRETLLEKYNSKSVLPFQWGVWVTALSRKRLKEGINLVGDAYAYSDTDSVKYIMYEGDGIAEKFEAYNKKLKSDSIANKAYATDPHGITHYMGVYEFEDRYIEFRTLGAKKYCYRTEDGKLHTTIAGVSKKKAPEELESAGGIDAFKIGFTFYSAGGTESKYHDTNYGIYTVTDNGIEHTLNITRNLSILSSTYTVSITPEYSALLSDARELKELKKYVLNT